MGDVVGSDGWELVHVDGWYESDREGMYPIQGRVAKGQEGAGGSAVQAGHGGTESVLSFEAGGRAGVAGGGNLASLRGRPADEIAEVPTGGN